MYILSFSENNLLFISLFGMLQGFLLAGLLYFHPESDRSVNKFLAMYITCLFISMLEPIINGYRVKEAKRLLLINKTGLIRFFQWALKRDSILKPLLIPFSKNLQALLLPNSGAAENENGAYLRKPEMPYEKLISNYPH